VARPENENRLGLKKFLNIFIATYGTDITLLHIAAM